MRRQICRACGHKSKTPADGLCIPCLRARDGSSKWKYSRVPATLIVAGLIAWGIFLFWLLYIYPRH